MTQIMIVDDSETMLMSIGSILSRAGFEVGKAESAESALDQLNGDYKPNLVITDLNMGGMDGISLIKELRQKDDYKFTPILLLTTESRSDKRAQAKQAGATGWICKPVKQDDLLQVVNRVLVK